MSQCRGTTKKGDRCKRDSPQGSEYCSIHQDQEVRERTRTSKVEEWDREAIMTAALGFAVIGAIFLFRFRPR